MTELARRFGGTLAPELRRRLLGRPLCVRCQVAQEVSP